MFSSDFSKSINNILHERIVSPLYGAVALSWVSWNWKILYFTFFVSETSLPKNFNGTKVDYILENYSDLSYNYWYPLITAILLITIVPFIANGAYWLDLKFSVWRRRIKNEVNQNQLLTIEQSNQLRVEIHKQKEDFAKLINEKDLEINSFKENLLNLTESSKETSHFLTTTETALRAKDQTLDSVMADMDNLKKENDDLMENLKGVNLKLKDITDSKNELKIDKANNKLRIKFTTSRSLTSELLLNQMFIQNVSKRKLMEALNFLDESTMEMMKENEYIRTEENQFQLTDKGNSLISHLLQIDNLIRDSEKSK